VDRSQQLANLDKARQESNDRVRYRYLLGQTEADMKRKESRRVSSTSNATRLVLVTTGDSGAISASLVSEGQAGAQAGEGQAGAGAGEGEAQRDRE
jgi:hypothetical protein